ncbi:MAG: hypothetical protein GC161_09010 [Planctomycetaceae bacterium]|nr:hypothetical protein [Planctomycetaceae bacterium]
MNGDEGDTRDTTEATAVLANQQRSILVERDGTTRVYLNPRAVFDDDGRQVLAVNAWSYPPAHQIFEDREAFHSALAKLSGTVDRPGQLAFDPREKVVLARLERMGVLLSYEPPEQEGMERGRGAALGTFTLEIELGRVCQEKLARTEAIVDSLPQRIGDLKRVVVRLVGEEPLAELDDLSRVLEAVGNGFKKLGLDKESLGIEIVSPFRQRGVDLAAMLDTNPYARVIHEDRSEISPIDREPEARAHARARVEELTDGGFGVTVRMLTTLSEGVPDRARAWNASNDRYGIEIAPLLLPRWHGRPVESIVDQPMLRTALDTLAELTRQEVELLHRHEPWRQTLLFAVHAGWGLVHWDKLHSRLWLDVDGKLYRSGAHRHLGLAAHLEELLPTLDDGPIERSDAQTLPNTGAAGWPNCPRCVLAPLCDKYWTPEGDAAQRAGLPELAKLIASFACGARTTMLTTLLDEWRSMANNEPPGKLRLLFEEGKVHYLAR